MSIDMDDLLTRVLREAGSRYRPSEPPTDLFVRRWQLRRVLRGVAVFAIAAAVVAGIALGAHASRHRVEPIGPNPKPNIRIPAAPAIGPNRARVGQIAAVSATTAWAFTGDSAGGVHLWRTVDGGKSWRAVVMNLSWAPGFDPTGAVFPDAERAFIHSSAGDFWFITSNGGKTWRYITLPRHQGPRSTDTYLFGDAEQSWFQVLDDSTILWTVEYGYGSRWVCPNSAPRECDGKHPHPNRTLDRIFALRNGSSLWSELTPAPFAGPMWFIDGRHAWGITDDPYGQDQSSNAKIFWHTSDGGRTWKSSRIPNGLVLHASPVFVTPLDGFALATGQRTSKLDPTSVVALQTHDGGSSWAVGFVLHPPDARSGVPETGSLAVPDATHLYAAIGNTVVMSSDGGKSFTSIPLARRQDAHGRVWTARTVSFTDPLHGWALLTCEAWNETFVNVPPSCGTSIFVTADGGSTWLPVKAPS